MSTYQELKGLKVKYLAANPNPGTAGDVWYDSATYQLKGFVGRAAWSAGSLYVISADHTAGTGTQTATLSASDGIPSPAAEVTSTYEYNGSGWASGGSMNTGRGDGYMNMAGTQTAAFYVGGRPNGSPPVPFGSVKTEEYNGSSWTETGDYPAGMRGVGAFGIQTAGVAAGGNDGSPSTATATNNEYDGSSWTSGNNNNTARFNAAAFGTSTAGILVGGYSNPPATTHALTEEYDGSSWTESGDLPAANNGLAGGGIQTAGLVFGGSAPSVTTATLNYDGSTWTASPGSLSTARTLLGGAKGGTSLSNLAWCGTPQRNITEEYHNTFEVVTAGAWASGNTMNNTTHEARQGAGLQTAAVVWGGYQPSPANNTVDTEEYDGTSWTETANSVTGVTQAAGFGIQTAAVSAGGFDSDGNSGPHETQYLAITEEYNGSSWTAGELMAAADGRSALRGCGTLTAGLAIGGARPGVTPSYLAFVEEYDGTDWTAVTALPGARGYGMTAGTQTAALYAGGYTSPPATRHDESYEYDGTNWTAGGDLLTGKSASLSFQAGTQTDAMHTGGSDGTATISKSEGYDGTSWSTRPNCSNAREDGAGAGTAALGLAAGKNTAPRGITEEFTGETSAETASTIDFD